MTSAARRLRFVLALLLAALFAGCFGRQETVKAVSQLGSTSERAQAVANQLKASDTAKTETLGKLYDSLLDALKADAEHEVDARVADFMREVNARETAALREMFDQRKESLDGFYASLTTIKKPLVDQATAAQRDLDLAHSQLDLHPNDQDLQKK